MNEKDRKIRRTARLALVAMLVVGAGGCGRRAAVVRAGNDECPDLAEVDHPQHQNIEALPAFPMPPDPAAAPFMQLDSQSRWQAVAKARRAMHVHR